MRACPQDLAAGHLSLALQMDLPPQRFQLALRLTALGAQLGLTVSSSLAAADIASQFAPPSGRAIWFGLAGGSTALASWRVWGWVLKGARS